MLNTIFVQVVAPGIVFVILTGLIRLDAENGLRQAQHVHGTRQTKHVVAPGNLAKPIVLDKKQ
jgi:hypothetical protein